MNPRFEIYGVEIDILLFIVVFDLLAYCMYAYVYGKNIKQMATQDFKLSLIGMTLVALNYYGTGSTIPVFGYDMSWFWYYVIMDTFFSICLMVLYMKYYKLTIKDF